MKMWQITFQVRADQVETVVGLLIGSVRGMSAREVDDSNGAHVRKSRKIDISGERQGQAKAAILKAMEGKQEHYYQDLGKVIGGLGYAETSISPVTIF
jgi:hypothetical protein